MDNSLTIACRERIVSRIRDFLCKQEEIAFAILFGSFNDKKEFRDIDIAIYLAGDSNLLKIGYLKSELDLLTKNNVDLVLLNNLYNKNPVLSYEIAAKGSVLCTRDPGLFYSYKKRAFLIFFDTEYLRDRVNKAFKKRVNEKKFGQRDYA